MMTRACHINSLNRYFWALILVIVLAGTASAATITWKAPGHWSEIGTVEDWVKMDARFYRIQEESQFIDESQAGLDQVREYSRTWEYRGRVDGVGMKAWKALSVPERKQRRSQAQRELKYLVDFRTRLKNQIRSTEMGAASGWGELTSDRAVVGTGLSKLRTAVGLDPSNPYAWHLYSYFALLVGDEYRSQQALAGAAAALAAVPEGELKSLRAAVDLDKAWLLRSQGEFAAAQTALESAGAHGVRSIEARLLQGLLAAHLGNDQLAITVATELRRAEVRKFPRDSESAGFGPEVTNVALWNLRTSSYLHDWIMAYTWLREGKVSLASAALGTHKADDQRPFAHRFWNEAGVIYEITGRRALAEKAWNQARVATPYYPYFVVREYQLNLGKLTGRAGHVPYQLGFDSNFLNGNRLAYGSAMVQAVAAETDTQRKQELASRALDQLEICQRFGLYRGQASVLQGQVYFLMGDMESALVEIEEALEHLDAQGDKAGFSAILAGLSQTRENLAPQDIANFYGQSGTSRSRWQADVDPAATGAALQRAYDRQADAENRQNLARFLIRNGQVTAGRALAEAPLTGSALDHESLMKLAASDVELILEADRLEGETTLAVAMTKALEAGLEDPWQSANVWTLAGFICLDHGLHSEGRTALERAAKLDPGNHGLRLQLSMM